MLYFMTKIFDQYNKISLKLYKAAQDPHHRELGPATDPRQQNICRLFQTYIHKLEQKHKETNIDIQFKGFNQQQMHQMFQNISYVDEKGNKLKKLSKKLISLLVKGFELPTYRSGELQKQVVALEFFLFDWQKQQD